MIRLIGIGVVVGLLLTMVAMVAPASDSWFTREIAWATGPTITELDTHSVGDDWVILEYKVNHGGVYEVWTQCELFRVTGNVKVGGTVTVKHFEDNTVYPWMCTEYGCDTETRYYSYRTAAHLKPGFWVTSDTYELSPGTDYYWRIRMYWPDQYLGSWQYEYFTTAGTTDPEGEATIWDEMVWNKLLPHGLEQWQIKLALGLLLTVGLGALFLWKMGSRGLLLALVAMAGAVIMFWAIGWFPPYVVLLVAMTLMVGIVLAVKPKIAGGDS